MSEVPSSPRTRALREAGLSRPKAYELTGPLPAFAVPTTLHDSLMARLDRLVGPRQIAQLGATLGREFTHDLLGQVSTLACGLTEDELRDGLRQLVEAELLIQSPSRRFDTGVARWQPEIHRLRGELLLAKEGHSSAVIERAGASFREARDLAETQGSVSLRDRANESLERLKSTG